MTDDRLFGKYEGVVDRVDDPLGLGRITAEVPAVYGDGQPSPWAWPCAPMAGSGRGALLLPERGDLVWVEFAAGDPSRPIWAGTFWKQAEPALPAIDGATADGKRRIIRTRAGHTIALDDDGGVVVAACDDKATIRLTEAGEVVVTAGTIKLGGAGASEKLVLGDAFLALFNRHVHPTGVGPSGPPQEPMNAGSHLSRKARTE